MSNILSIEGIPVLYAEDSASANAGLGVRLKGNALTGALLVDIGSTAITANLKPSTGVVFTGNVTSTSAAISTAPVTDSAGFVLVNTGSKPILFGFDNSTWIELLSKSSFSLDSENLTFYVKTTAPDTSTYALVIQQQLP